MTTEEHLRAICGNKDFEIALLRSKVDELQAKLADGSNGLDKSQNKMGAKNATDSIRSVQHPAG